MTDRTKTDEDRYLRALALAHMLSPDGTDEEDFLADALNTARDRLGMSDEEIDQYQLHALDFEAAWRYSSSNTKR